MGSKTEKDKMDGKSFPILEDLGEEEDANIKVRRAGILQAHALCDGGGGGSVATAAYLSVTPL